MYTVVLTGGIASGKSTVSALFEQLGAPVFDADVIARALCETPHFLRQIANQFGDAILDSDGQLIRATLRKIIFNDPDAKQWLESLLHPPIIDSLNQAARQNTHPYCILAIPLFVESTVKPNYDRVLLVDIPRKLQLLRLIERDQCTEPMANQILQQQASRDERRLIADDIILNTQDISKLTSSVSHYHELYLTQGEN